MEVFFSKTRFTFGDELDEEREWTNKLPAKACSWVRIFDVRLSSSRVMSIHQDEGSIRQPWAAFI